MSCCQKQSQLYLIFTNFLFFILGCAVVSFGTMAIELKISNAVLIPVNILKSIEIITDMSILTYYLVISLLGIMLIFTSLIGLLASFCRERKSIHILCTTTVVIAFMYQVSIAAIVYIQAANTSSWLSQTWAEASIDYRSYAQTKFDCCGFTNPLDHPVQSNTCVPHQVMDSSPPCYGPMNHYIKQELTHIYVALFAGLVIELLALCNSITQLCTMNPRRSWEVSPESCEQKRRPNNRNCSSETLVNTMAPVFKRQF
ncbi:unnamed protein product [Rhizopus stolonifer]